MLGKVVKLYREKKVDPVMIEAVDDDDGLVIRIRHADGKSIDWARIGTFCFDEDNKIVFHVNSSVNQKYVAVGTFSPTIKIVRDEKYDKDLMQSNPYKDKLW